MSAPHNSPDPEDRDPSGSPLMRPADFYTSVLFLAVVFLGLGSAALYALFR